MHAFTGLPPFQLLSETFDSHIGACKVRKHFGRDWPPSEQTDDFSPYLVGNFHHYHCYVVK